jgi:hypothetical protein
MTAISIFRDILVNVVVPTELPRPWSNKTCQKARFVYSSRRDDVFFWNILGCIQGANGVGGGPFSLDAECGIVEFGRWEAGKIRRNETHADGNDTSHHDDWKYCSSQYIPETSFHDVAEKDASPLPVTKNFPVSTAASCWTWRVSMHNLFCDRKNHRY